MKLDDETQRALHRTLAPTTAYFTATRALTRGQIEPDELLVMARIIQRMTLASLVQLVRETHDWCAWVPLLVLVMRARRRDRSEDLRAAEHNLRLLGRRLLDAQGFARVRVDDVLAHPPQLQVAMQEMVLAPRRRR